MKGNKGFTLIELLAVIVILAAIALISSVVVVNIISDANKSTFKSSVEGLYRTIIEDYTANGYITKQEYIITSNTIINKTAEEEYTITFNGKIDDGSGTAEAYYNEATGALIVNLKVQNNSFCATSIDGKNEYTITEGKCE